MAARKLKTITEEEQREYEARLDDVRSFAAALPERFLYCREMGHRWQPLSAGHYQDGGFERVLKCSRCRCKRFQTIDSRGIIIKSHYEHPAGYLTEGIGHIVGEGRGMLRLESINRLVPKFEVED